MDARGFHMLHNRITSIKNREKLLYQRAQQAESFSVVELLSMFGFVLGSRVRPFILTYMGKTLS